ncbi:hypothetical protein BV898_11702 [Hypsibius exemplaris]|uniref:Uncharacterized protein n=1 Tax=Hypsibius exemplaris TaxID=2072580 RepID=A0A1W0WG08_HYPEX|nr:hypothetical protein BV898_11702 [Hypsibius exemplaris]
MQRSESDHCLLLLELIIIEDHYAVSRTFPRSDSASSLTGTVSSDWIRFVAIFSHLAPAKQPASGHAWNRNRLMQTIKFKTAI